METWLRSYNEYEKICDQRVLEGFLIEWRLIGSLQMLKSRPFYSIRYIAFFWIFVFHDENNKTSDCFVVRCVDRTLFGLQVLWVYYTLYMSL